MLKGNLFICVNPMIALMCVGNADRDLDLCRVKLINLELLLDQGLVAFLLIRKFKDVKYMLMALFMDLISALIIKEKILLGDREKKVSLKIYKIL